MPHVPHIRTPRPTRRGLLATGGALGLGAALTACGGGTTTGGTSGKTGRAWTFRDDRGATVKLAQVPANIVAFTGAAAALYDYGIQVKGVFGPTTTKDGKADVQAGDMDVSKVTVLGDAWGQFSIEKYAALAPDVLISTMYDGSGTLWYVPQESAKTILELAPSVGISAYDRQLPKSLARMLELAVTLGADAHSAHITAARKRFEAAADRLRRAAASRPEIRVLVGSASQDVFYVCGSRLPIDLAYFKALGVNLVEPPANTLKASGGWFQNLSWENVDRYPADIVMMDDRTSAIQPADITQPTWHKLPAVRAGQVIPRAAEPILSYDKCAPILDGLSKAIETAKRVG
jgi:iron complex transport system substrate-binding protein